MSSPAPKPITPPSVSTIVRVALNFVLGVGSQFGQNGGFNSRVVRSKRIPVIFILIANSLC